jgi:hypothetical protein
VKNVDERVALVRGANRGLRFETPHFLRHSAPPSGFGDLMFTSWLIVAGILLIGMALAGSALKRVPLSASMFYLAAGGALGPWGVGLLHVNGGLPSDGSSRSSRARDAGARNIRRGR